METVAVNSVGAVRRVVRNGRRYLVAPMTLIVPGVLNGSMGALYYPPEEVGKEPERWNDIPIVLYHPTDNGRPVSGRRPDVLDRVKVGRLYNSRYDRGRLLADGWFDEESTRRVDPRVHHSLTNSQLLGLSTGLFTDNYPARPNSVDPVKGRPYDYVARNYRPDHLALLPDQVGACSIKDGCGVLINSFCPTGPGGGVNPHCSPGGTVTTRFAAGSATAKAVSASDQALAAAKDSDAEAAVIKARKLARRAQAVVHGTGGGTANHHANASKAHAKAADAHRTAASRIFPGPPRRAHDEAAEAHDRAAVAHSAASASGGQKLSGNARRRRPSSGLNMSPAKACKIVKDGTVHGKPLTEKQRGMFGALCGKRAAGTRNAETPSMNVFQKLGELIGAAMGVGSSPAAPADPAPVANDADEGDEFATDYSGLTPINDDDDDDDDDAPDGDPDDPGDERTDNAFCPTGPGGGINPSCSPGGGGAGGSGGGSPVAQAASNLASKGKARLESDDADGGKSRLVIAKSKGRYVSSHFSQAKGEEGFTKSEGFDLGSARKMSAEDAVKKAIKNFGKVDRVLNRELDPGVYGVTNQETPDMRLTPEQRASYVDSLVANCECNGQKAPWAGKNKAELNQLSDDTLSAYEETRKAMTANSVVKPGPAESFVDALGNRQTYNRATGQWETVPAQNTGTPPNPGNGQQTPSFNAFAPPPAIPRTKTAEEWAAEVFPGMNLQQVQNAVRSAIAVDTQARTSVIEQITVNLYGQAKEAMVDLLKDKSLAELQLFRAAIPAGNSAQPQGSPSYAPDPMVANYFGAQGGGMGGVFSGLNEEPLRSPVYNFEPRTGK